MKARDKKLMTCCQNDIRPKLNSKKEPLFVTWTCQICGERFVQKIMKSNLTILEIVESINSYKASKNVTQLYESELKISL